MLSGLRLLCAAPFFLAVVVLLLVGTLCFWSVAGLGYAARKIAGF